VPYYPLLAIVTKTDLSVACEVWVRKNWICECDDLETACAALHGVTWACVEFCILQFAYHLHLYLVCPLGARVNFL
jgi:hypothetical protein